LERVGFAPRSDSQRQLGRSIVRLVEAATESAANAFKGAFTALYDFAVWAAAAEIQFLTAVLTGDVEGAKGALKQAWQDVVNTYNRTVDGVANFLLVTVVAPEYFSQEQRADAWGGLIGNLIGTMAAGGVMEGAGPLGRGLAAGMEAAEAGAAEAGGCGGLCFVAGTLVATADGSEVIEEIAPGERVLSQDDPNASAEDEPDQRTWCLCHICLRDQQSGSVYEIDVLKPASWLLELSAMSDSGTEVMYGLEEEGVHGPAQLVGVEQCPPILKGEGRVVLAAIRSQSNNVYDLKLSDSAETLHPTGRHRFYSMNRGDWIAAKDLYQGEHVKKAYGETVVEYVGPRSGLYPVYNITVQKDHCYYVGSHFTLTHNDGCAGVYDVGLAKDLRANPMRGTQVNHGPMSAQAESLVGRWKSINKVGYEPSIRLPNWEHEAVNAAQAARTNIPASARELLAQEIRILRNNTNAPNSALRELIDLNKKIHPEDYWPLHRNFP
jgi:hypothetical protein